MALATWWRGDAIPQLSAIPGLTVEVNSDVDQVAQLTGLSIDEVTDHIAAGHRAYIASLDGTPVSYGWVATVSASIGELALDFALPAGDRYLWDFMTLSSWRGRGIYPRLLQRIMECEGADARRFWIIYAPENPASGAGIAKAGFKPVSDLAFLSDGRAGAVAVAGTHRARLGAALLGVPLFEAVQGGRIVSPCWRCVIERHANDSSAAVCWPQQQHRSTHTCACVPAPAAVR